MKKLIVILAIIFIAACGDDNPDSFPSPPSTGGDSTNPDVTLPPVTFPSDVQVETSTADELRATPGLGLRWNGDDMPVYAMYRLCYRNAAGGCNELASGPARNGQVLARLGKELTLDQLFDGQQTPGRIYLEFFDNSKEAGKGIIISFPITVDSDVINKTVQYFKTPMNDFDDQFGSSVAISGDGLTLAISAPGDDSRPDNPASNNFTNSGIIFVYTYTSSGWALGARLKSNHIDPNDMIGLYNIALDDNGDTLIVSAEEEALQFCGRR